MHKEHKGTVAPVDKQAKVVTARSALTEMSLYTRLGLLGLLFLVQLLYFPINRIITGGAVLEIPWDVHIPFSPVWVVPYLLSLVWWIGCYIWAAVKMEARLYRAFVASALFTMLTSYAVFILYPTYIIRPEVEGAGWAVDLLRWVYAHDRLNNAFPSGHTYMTMLIVFYWWRWRPSLRLLWSMIAVIIIISTLLTGQHNLLDPLGGLFWAWIGYSVGLWLEEWWTNYK